MKRKYWSVSLIFVAVAIIAGYQNEGQAEAGRTVRPIPKNFGPKAGTHIEVASIGKAPGTKFGRLTAFALTPEENLLVCDAESNEIKLIDPNGKTIDTWKLDFAPYVIHSCRCGEVFAASVGIVAKFDKYGKLTRQVKAEDSAFPNTRPAGIGVFGSNVFVAFVAEDKVNSRSVILRFNRDFSNPTIIARDMRPCCGRLDLVAWEDVLYLAESARNRVIRMNREGKVLSKWAPNDPHEIESRTCNTMALYYSPDNTLYTAESALGRIERYTPKGKFINLVVSPAQPRPSSVLRRPSSEPCTNTAVAATKDGSRVYALDSKNNLIRVLERKNSGK